MKLGLRALFASALLLAVTPASAVLDIQITQGQENAIPIAVTHFEFQGGGQPPQDVASIVSNDLRRSGKFRPLSPQEMLPVNPDNIDLGPWRERGVPDVVVGRVTQAGNGQYVVSFQLMDSLQNRQLISFNVPAAPSEMRKAAHKVADLIYEAITGKRGAFSARIAYITVEGQSPRRYALQVADSDGYNPSTIVNSTDPLLSPSWSPDGRKLAYVSFEHKRPEVFVQNLLDGSRMRVSGRAGLNSAPAWSPDGRKLAITLSDDGNADIYLLNVGDQSLSRVTNDPNIDTEPDWAPDGQSLYFTSSRSGQPQIYRVSAQGGRAQRVSFDGPYNAAPDVSPDGREIALVHGENGRYRIGILDLASGTIRIMTEGFLDESPSFAPNGDMIIYATEYRSRGVLAAVSQDGRFKQQLGSTTGDVREPVWSPFPQE